MPRLVLIFLLALSGCATQILNQSELTDQVEHLLGQHNYTEAWHTIALYARRNNVQDSDLQALRERVTSAATRYEMNTINAASKLASQNNWHGAETIYRDALRQQPESAAIGAAQNEFVQLRNDYIARLRLTQYAGKALYINAEVEQLEKILQAQPSDQQARQELEQQLQRRDMVASTLLDAGQTALQDGDFEQARQFLTLSNNLRASLDSQASLTQLPRIAKRVPPKRIARPKPQVSEPFAMTRPDASIDAGAEYGKAMAAYHSAKERDDLYAAKQQLAKASLLQPGNRSLQSERQSLHRAIAKRVAEKLENGKYLYSIGEIDAAIAAWQTAASLAPEDQSLRLRLDRAQKFRERFEELKR